MNFRKLGPVRYFRIVTHCFHWLCGSRGGCLDFRKNNIRAAMQQFGLSLGVEGAEVAAEVACGSPSLIPTLSQRGRDGELGAPTLPGEHNQKASADGKRSIRHASRQKLSPRFVGGSETDRTNVGHASRAWHQSTINRAEQMGAACLETEAADSEGRAHVSRPAFTQPAFGNPTRAIPALRPPRQRQEPLMDEQAPADRRICEIAANVVEAFSLKHPSVAATPKQWIDLQMMIALAIKLGAEGK